jgi:hypothetical protein
LYGFGSRGAERSRSSETSDAERAEAAAEWSAEGLRHSGVVFRGSSLTSENHSPVPDFVAAHRTKTVDIILAVVRGPWTHNNG